MIFVLNKINYFNFNYFSFYLGSLESKCNFKQNGKLCAGKPKLVIVKNYQTSISSYIIGCDKYKQNDKYHWYIKIDPSIINIALLRDLFNGSARVVRKNNNDNNNYCFD